MLDDLTGDAVWEMFEISSEGSGTDGTLETLSIHGLAQVYMHGVHLFLL